ncbi:MAG: sigma factor-like helix-turn-helix DNA-binding protein [Cyclobacteriaceae bacterium]
MDIWTKRRSLTIQKNLKIYLLTAVKYKVYRIIYKRKLTCHLSNLEDGVVRTDLPKILEFEELYQKIEVAVEKLPASQKEAFKLSRINQLSTLEIARKLNIAPQTVHNKIHLSLLFIRAELKHYLLWLSLIILSISIIDPF